MTISSEAPKLFRYGVCSTTIEINNKYNSTM
nr:MAG TPA_asm: hypothetical protein [Bacteriophage sp.]